jgi:hypothetical protein
MLIFLDFEMHEEDSYMRFFFFFLEEGYKLSRDFCVSTKFNSLLYCDHHVSAWYHILLPSMAAAWLTRRVNQVVYLSRV